jgi:hypothetical protein
MTLPLGDYRSVLFDQTFFRGNLTMSAMKPSQQPQQQPTKPASQPAKSGHQPPFVECRQGIRLLAETQV